MLEVVIKGARTGKADSMIAIDPIKAPSVTCAEKLLETVTQRPVSWISLPEDSMHWGISPFIQVNSWRFSHLLGGSARDLLGSSIEPGSPLSMEQGSPCFSKQSGDLSASGGSRLSQMPQAVRGALGIPAKAGDSILQIS